MEKRVNAAKVAGNEKKLDKLEQSILVQPDENESDRPLCEEELEMLQDCFEYESECSELKTQPLREECLFESFELLEQFTWTLQVTSEQ